MPGNLKSLIESILFVTGAPVAVSRLAKISGAKPKELAAVLGELRGEYRERGIILVEDGESWQFATNPANRSTIRELVAAERSADLSKAGLEVLAIIAYKGPLSRAGIEYVRGVNSSFTLRNLLIRGLIERNENPEDRRAYLYRISMEFLKYLGLGGPEELPHYREFRERAVEIPTPPEESP